ncbi:LapA family protein [Sediminibacillus massiliensis]|uniref:LapA family protein n=1 Tax=Sediminibacillus massiliensis TaxID=1926277 RepID=UPI000988534A|nr:lipopolysaccharide assembly protein LapA domain-containing protein [Sediminibacillus massiliensis]
MKGQSYIILALVFALIVAIFAVINVDPVEVNYLFGTGNAPLILVILISALMGGIITAAVGGVRLLRMQREVKALKKSTNESSRSHSSKKEETLANSDTGRAHSETNSYPKQ